jgi:hypothetical protein
MTESHQATIRELANTLTDIHKKELSTIFEIHKHELAIKDAYLEGYKKEILEQLATERLKVIELKKDLEAKNARIAELKQRHPE